MVLAHGAILTAIIVSCLVAVNPLYAKIRQLTDQLVNLTREHAAGHAGYTSFRSDPARVQTFRNRNGLYKTWQIRTELWLV